MNHFEYSDLYIGQKECFTIVITENMMHSFRDITGDNNPLHNDRGYALKHGFPDRVCFGMLTASFLSTMAGVYIPGERSLIQSVESKFSSPVILGDTIHFMGEIIELNDTVCQIVLKVTATNQDGRIVLSGKMKIGITNE